MPASLRSRLASACVVVAASPLLASCDGDAAAGPSPLPTRPAASSTPPTTPSASPAVKAPVRPANADDYSAAGMEAFTRYAIAVFNYAYATGDTRPLKGIATPKCKVCNHVDQTVSQIWAAGGVTRGSELRVLTINTAGPLRNVAPTVDAELSLSEFVWIDATGKVRARERGVPRDRYYFDLSRKGGQWRLGGARIVG